MLGKENTLTSHQVAAAVAVRHADRAAAVGAADRDLLQQLAAARQQRVRGAGCGYVCTGIVCRKGPQRRAVGSGGGWECASAPARAAVARGAWGGCQRRQVTPTFLLCCQGGAATRRRPAAPLLQHLRRWRERWVARRRRRRRARRAAQRSPGVAAWTGDNTSSASISSAMHAPRGGAILERAARGSARLECAGLDGRGASVAIRCGTGLLQQPLNACTGASGRR